MLRLHPYWWGLLLIGLIFAGVITVAASLLEDAGGAPWEVTAIDVVDRQTGAVQLQVKGEGLHKGIKALLIPEMKDADIIGGPIALSVMLYLFETDGRLAVATGRDRRLITIDVSDGQKPTILGGLNLPQRESVATRPQTTALQLIGSKVVVSRSLAGLELLDVSDPAQPKSIDFLPIRERLLDMRGVGEHVYVTSDKAGLFAITLEGNRLISRRVAGSRPAARVTVENRRMVTASHQGELAFYDLDGQGYPHLAATLQTATDIRDLVFAQGALFVCTASGELLEFTLDAWPRPVLAGKLALKGRPLKLEWSKSSRQLFTILVGSGLAVIDISQSGQPQLARYIPLEKSPVSVNARTNRLFISGVNGLRVLPLEKRGEKWSAPQVDYPFSQTRGRRELIRWNSAVFAYDRMALRKLSSGKDEGRSKGESQSESIPFLVLPDGLDVRLHAIEEGVPTAEIIGRIKVYDEAESTGNDTRFDHVIKAFWRHGHVYALTRTKLSVFAVDHFGKVLSREDVRLQGQMVDMEWLSDGSLVLATDGPGMTVLEVRHSGAPRVIGEYPMAKYQRLSGAVKKLLVDGNRLYVARSRLGLEIYDLANPAAPRLLQRIDTPGFATDLTLHERLMLVADNDHGIFVVDVSGQRALPIGSYRVPNACTEISCDGDVIYMGNSSGGIIRLPAPVKLPAPDLVSDQLAELLVPSGVAPGPYKLALYDEKAAVNTSVNIK